MQKDDIESLELNPTYNQVDDSPIKSMNGESSVLEEVPTPVCDKGPAIDLYSQALIFWEGTSKDANEFRKVIPHGCLMNSVEFKQHIPSAC